MQIVPVLQEVPAESDPPEAPVLQEVPAEPDPPEAPVLQDMPPPPTLFDLPMVPGLSTKPPAYPFSAATPFPSEESLAAHKPVVRNLQERMSFAHHFLQLMQVHLPQGCMAYLIHALPKHPFSTAFSGVDAFGTAVPMLVCAINDATGLHVPEPPHMHACENFVESQKELCCHPNPPQCLYGDVLDFLHKPILAEIEKLRQSGATVDIDSLLPMVHSKKAVKRSARCLIHKSCCPMRKSKLHVAGISCTDWAPVGKQERAAGPTAVAFAAWAAARTLAAEPVFIVENSHLYDETVLARTFPHYQMMPAVVDAVDFGMAMRRKRKYMVLVKSSLIHGIWGSLGNVLRIWHRQCVATFHMVMVAHQSEIDAELNWMLTRPERASKLPPSVIKNQPDPFLQCLTDREEAVRLEYLRQGCGLSQAMQLNQNAWDGWGTTSSVEGELQTITKNCGLLWVHTTPTGEPINRPLAPMELLLAQGFPVRAAYGNPVSGRAHKCCSFAEPDVRATPRVRHHVAGQAGNAFCVSVVGAVYLYVILCIRRIDQQME